MLLKNWTSSDILLSQKVNYFSLAVTICKNMEVEQYIYEYNTERSHMYKISYPNNSKINTLHTLLKFKLNKKYIVICNNKDYISIIAQHNKKIKLKNYTNNLNKKYRIINIKYTIPIFLNENNSSKPITYVNKHYYI
jgi:hypothetical protein